MMLKHVYSLGKIFGERELLDEDTSELGDGSNCHRQTLPAVVHLVVVVVNYINTSLIGRTNIIHISLSHYF